MRFVPIYNQMVINEKQLDLVFGALSDATRRGILAQLSEGQTNITTLAKPYDISQPAISKHLRVLEKAGLIEKSKQGREYVIRANPIPAEQAGGWIAFYARYWKQHFDAVEQYLQKHGGGS